MLREDCELDNSSDDQEESTTNNIEAGTCEDDPYRLNQKAKLVEKSVREWTKAMTPKRSLPDYADMPTAKAMAMNITPWFKAWFELYKTIFMDYPRYVLLSPSKWNQLLDPSSVDGIKVLWALKFSVGATLLLIKVLYWKNYEKFDDQGWQLVSYAFASTFTSEGTVKKSGLRFVGTLVGGFSAWLGLTVCASSSYDNEINPYGLIAWMTATTAITIYLGTETGFLARMGTSHDYGYAAQLFVVTQSIITLYAVNGQGTKDELVVGRIVSNIDGIFVAIVFALLPSTLR